MAKMMKRGLALAIALVLIMGQLTMPVYATTHEEVLEDIADMIEIGAEGEIEETVQEQIDVPGEGTVNVESTTKAEVTREDAPPAEHSAQGEVTHERPNPENPNPENPDPENPGPQEPKPEEPKPEEPETGSETVYYETGPDGNPVLDDEGNPIPLDAPPAAELGTGEEGTLSEGDWLPDGQENYTDLQEDDWDQVSGTTTSETFIPVEYDLTDNGDGTASLTADITKEVLQKIGFTEDEIKEYNDAIANPETTSWTALTTILNRKDAASKLGDHSYQVTIDAATGLITIRMFSPTVTGDWTATGDANIPNPDPQWETDSTVITFEIIPDYEYAEGDKVNEKDAEDNAVKYTKERPVEILSQDEATGDFNKIETTEDITKTVKTNDAGDTIGVAYEVVETKVQTEQVTRDLQQAIADNIITQEDVDKIVSAENAEQAKKNNSSAFYIDPVPASGLTGATITATAQSVTVELNPRKDDGSNELIPGAAPVTTAMPILTATGVNSENYTTTEVYTPAVLDGNLVYQRVATWVDSQGVTHEQTDYIYGELKTQTQTFTFVPDPNGAGTVVTTTTITSERTKTIDSTRKVENKSQTITGTQGEERITLGEMTEYQFTADPSGKTLFTLGGVTYDVIPESQFTNTLNEVSTDNWILQKNGGIGFQLGGGNMQEFIVVEKDGVTTRKVYCVEKGISDQQGSDRELTDEYPAENPDLVNLNSKLDKLTTVAEYGYWGEEMEGGESYQKAKALLSEYLTNLGSSRPDYMSGYTNDQILANLTCYTATAGTQWAMWSISDPEKIEGMTLTSESGAAFACAARALKDALVNKADTSPAAPLPKVVQATGDIESLTLKGEATDADGNKKMYVEKDEQGNEKKDEQGNTIQHQVYNADMMFSLSVDRTNLTGDQKITVTGMDGLQSEFILQESSTGVRSWVNGALAGLTGAEIVEADEEGKYILKNVQIAEGVTIDLEVSAGIQNMGKGVVIYHHDTLQDFISLTDEKTNEVKLNMSLTFDETDLDNPDGAKAVSGGKGVKVDTRTAGYKKVNNRTDVTSYITVISDPAAREETMVSQVTVKGEIRSVTMSSKLIKEFEPVDVTFEPEYDDEYLLNPRLGGRRFTGTPHALANVEADGELVILDEDVPLADAAVTGDMSFLWSVVGTLSLGASRLLKKKEEDET